MFLAKHLALITFFVSVLALDGCKSMERPDSDALAISDQDLPVRRPSIHEISPQNHNIGGNWERVREGLLESLAQMISMHEGKQIYFLARDGEYLYDLAKILLGKSSKVKLLNISRDNLYSNELKQYLEQEGVSEASLLKGKKVVFVDSGFAGSIPDYISGLFSHQAAKKIDTHLLCSETNKYPSSRVFLTKISSSGVVSQPASYHHDVVKFEHTPHWETKASGFEYYVDGDGYKLRATVKSQYNTYGYSHSSDTGFRGKALVYMQSLRHWAEKKQTKEKFNKRLKFWREVDKRMKVSTKSLNSFLLGELKKAKTASERLFVQAAAHDIVDLHSVSQARLSPDKKTVDLIDNTVKIDHLTESNPSFAVRTLLRANNFERSVEIYKNTAKNYQPQILDSFYEAFSEGVLNELTAEKVLRFVQAKDKNAIHILIDGVSNPDFKPHEMVMETAIKIAVKSKDVDLSLNTVEGIKSTYGDQLNKKAEAFLDSLIDLSMKQQKKNKKWNAVISSIIQLDSISASEAGYRRKIEYLIDWAVSQQKVSPVYLGGLLEHFFSVELTQKKQIDMMKKMTLAANTLPGSQSKKFFQAAISLSEGLEGKVWESFQNLFSRSIEIENVQKRRKFVAETIALQEKNNFNASTPQAVVTPEMRGAIVARVPKLGALYMEREGYSRSKREYYNQVVDSAGNAFEMYYFESNKERERFKKDFANFQKMQKAGVAIEMPIHAGENFVVFKQAKQAETLEYYLTQKFGYFALEDAPKMEGLKEFFQKLVNSKVNIEALSASDVKWMDGKWSIVRITGGVKSTSASKLKDIYSFLIDNEWRYEMRGQNGQNSCNFLLQIISTL